MRNAVLITPHEKNLWIFLGAILILNICFWLGARDLQARWSNVPPVPSSFSASGFGVGDLSFSHRAYGLMIQNLGDYGGRATAFKEYNYEYLGGWLSLLSKFDPHSDFLPFLASYYFGAVEDPAKLKYLVEYLAEAGNSNQGEKWRWLAQAVYLARFKMNDMDLALELAKKLSALDNPNVAQWARNMPANILNAKGDKEAAYELLVNILKDSAENMKPNEVNATIAYICEQVLEPEQAKINSLCQGEY